MLLAMCYNKLQIKNPSFDANKYWSRSTLTLPCGHCDECVQLMSSEYAFRAQMETQSCLGHKGAAYFNTFTYNDKFLPQVRLQNGALISTWNKKHIQKFIKRLRKFFSYYYDIDSNLLRYLITCERGSDKVYKRVKVKVDRKTGKKTFHTVTSRATKRPHYHSIFWLYAADQLPTIELPEWCNGETSLHKVFPIAFQHFWSSPDTNESYGHIDDEMLCRTPAIATKYVTKYIFKQSDDALFTLNLSHIAYHLQDIDRKDFQPFTLISNFVGAAFRPKLEHLTGEKQVTFLSSDNHACAINLPRYYFKRLCKQTTVTDEVKRSKTTAADWTVKDGFETSHYYTFFESEKTPDGWLKDGKLFPFEYKTKTVDTPLGEKVSSARFDSTVDDLYDRIMKFVRDPQHELKTAKKYNKLIHTEEYAIQFHNDPLDYNTVTYNPVTSQINSLKEDGTPIFDYVIRTDMPTYLRLGKSIEIIRLFLCSDSYTRQLLYVHDQSVWGELFDNAEANFKQAISDYLHTGIDTSMPLLQAIDEIVMFLHDMDMITSGIHRHNNSLKYRMQLPTAMTKSAPLFAPKEFSELTDITI